MAEPGTGKTANWLQPAPEEEGLRRYAETIRERIWLIVAVVALTSLVAIAYTVTATKMYQAEADLLVTPISTSDPAVEPLGLIQQSSDPTRDVETAAQLVTNIEVANAVQQQLHTPEGARDLLNKVSAQPVAQSNIVAITAEDSSPQRARLIANAFADAAVANRTQQMHAVIDRTLPSLQAQLRSSPGQSAGPGTLSAEIASLQVLRTAQDPTLRVETRADTPTSPSSPKPVLNVIGGVLAGLVLGIMAAFVSQALDTRLRRETQLRRAYSLPILARIPKEQRRSGDGPLNPRRASPPVSEAFRMLRTSIAASRRSSKHPDGHVIFVTGASPSDGKTSVAINLASALALGGNQVILIEGDLRRPSIGATLGLMPERGGVVSVLTQQQTLQEALISSPLPGPGLKLLLADQSDNGYQWVGELFSLHAADKLVADARQAADYVIIDSAPLNEVVDAMPLAAVADDILLVVRIGMSRLDKLAQLNELLAENGLEPSGFAIVGTERPKRRESHYYMDMGGISQGRPRTTEASINARGRM